MEITEEISDELRAAGYTAEAILDVHDPEDQVELAQLVDAHRADKPIDIDGIYYFIGPSEHSDMFGIVTYPLRRAPEAE